MIPSQPIVFIAGLIGAFGVGLSALAAHRADLPNLATAASMLLFHAPAFLALSAVSANRIRTVASWVLLAGLLLFTGDLLARSFLGTRLFPMAAPIGGAMLIGGWIGIALSGFLPTGQNQNKNP